MPMPLIGEYPNRSLNISGLDQGTKMNPRDCILLVDADPSSIAYLSSILSLHGQVRVAHSANVLEGALAVGAHLLAAVVDLGPPGGWSGLDVIAQLKRATPGTPTVLLGDGSRASAANASYLLGADYLEKPIDRACIERFMKSHMPFAQKLAAVTGRWQERYGMSEAQTDVLHRAALGEGRDTIAAFRSSSPGTVKRQIFDLLQKTGDESLHAAIERLTRDAIDI